MPLSLFVWEEKKTTTGTGMHIHLVREDLAVLKYGDRNRIQ